MKAGEKSEFRVHSVEPYQLSLWRYGFQKELVRSLGWFDEHGPRATMQITPDGDYTRPASPGTSTVMSTRTCTNMSMPPSGRVSTTFTHERPGERSSPFPGSSHREADGQDRRAGLEHHLECLQQLRRPEQLHQSGSTPADADGQRPARAQAVHRPRCRHLRHRRLCAIVVRSARANQPHRLDNRDHDPIEGRAACHIAPAEWRLLGWLEREHFAYDYYAETQLHDGTLDLDAYNVLMISTHPEYWSRTMYHAVKSWVHERGGKLMYLGGNGLNCEAEFVDPTTVIYRNGNARAMKQEGYESRFHMRVESEAKLLGVVFTETGIMTGAPYRVLNADHWALRGHRTQERRALRPGEPAHALSGRGVRS